MQRQKNWWLPEAEGKAEEIKGVIANGHRVSLPNDEKFLALIMVTFARSLNILKPIELYTLKW